MKGVEHYTTGSGFHAIKIHYSADPEKDPDTEIGRVWLEQAAQGYVGGILSSAWRREMEIDWDATGGELVFPQLATFKNRIVVPPFEVPESWSLYAAFDYGHRNPSSFNVYAIDFDGDIYSIWEYYKSGEGYRNIARAIRACPYYNRLSMNPVADPSIWAKNQQNDDGSVKSVAQLFTELPSDEQVIFIPGKKGGDITVAEKINSLLWNTDELMAGGKPRLKIFATCPMQIWELEKLRYKDWSATVREQKNLQEEIVDKDNHSYDSLKYFLMMFFFAPDAPKQEDRKLEALKSVDYASYREWMNIKKKMDGPKTPDMWGEL